MFPHLHNKPGSQNAQEIEKLISSLPIPKKVFNFSMGGLDLHHHSHNSNGQHHSTQSPPSGCQNKQAHGCHNKNSSVPCGHRYDHSKSLEANACQTDCMLRQMSPHPIHHNIPCIPSMGDVAKSLQAGCFTHMHHHMAAQIGNED